MLNPLIVDVKIAMLSMPFKCSPSILGVGWVHKGWQVKKEFKMTDIGVKNIVFGDVDE